MGVPSGGHFPVEGKRAALEKRSYEEMKQKYPFFRNLDDLSGQARSSDPSSSVAEIPNIDRTVMAV